MLQGVGVDRHHPHGGRPLVVQLVHVLVQHRVVEQSATVPCSHTPAAVTLRDSPRERGEGVGGSGGGGGGKAREREREGGGARETNRDLI